MAVYAAQDGGEDPAITHASFFCLYTETIQTQEMALVMRRQSQAV